MAKRAGSGLLVAAAALLATDPALGDHASVLLYRKNAQLDQLTIRNNKNVAYFGKFELGTSGQVFTGCFDTGSSDTWVPSTQCTNPSCMTHDRYNPQASSTGRTTGQRFQVTYGTGAVSGSVAYDTLYLGDYGSTIAVPNQAFGLVTDSSTDFLTASCDGLFGLGFPDLSNMKTTPAFFNMLDAKQLDAPAFAIWLNPDSNAEPSGEVTFGALNRTRFTGQITWTPVVEKAYWTIALSGAQVGDRPVALAATHAIIDSGTTAILVSPADAAAIHEGVPGVEYDQQAGYYSITGGCAAVHQLPRLAFVIDGRAYSMPGVQWTQSVQNADGSPTSQCISAVIPGGDEKSVILGNNFMRSWYTVFTYDEASRNAHVGLAPAAAGPS